MILSKYIPVIAGLMVLTVLAGGCRKAETAFGLKDDSAITVKAANGLYISADRYRNNQLIADRTSIGDWEKFTLEIAGENQVRLRASDYTYVGVSQDNAGVLSSGYSGTENNTVFTLIEVDSRGVLFRDHQNKYVHTDTSNVLRANTVNMEDAVLFVPREVPAEKLLYFPFTRLLPLMAGLILLLISLIAFQYREDKKISVVLLLLGGFSIRLFIAMLNSHLELWDEQYHALVAKNMMDRPFTPMLYKNPVLPYNETNWVGSHIWLHKQPLFLWQMALSMKIFGVNLFALRLPSMIMSTVVIFFIYRIGKISVNPTAGFFGALLFALANFVLEITAGVIHTDHNDVAFLFYVSASIWAWVEYEHTASPRKKYFILLIGLFSGCAILVKWLTGLLVFSGWGLSIILFKERRRQWVHYRNLLGSLLIAVAIFVPWQVYILRAFPVVSKHEFALNARHFFEVVEEHGGNFWWHFNVADQIYGLPVLLLLICLVIFFVSLKNKVFKTAFIAYVALIYVFFGLAATKMIAFTFCISFLVFLALGVAVEKYLKVVILNPEYFPAKIHKVIYTTLLLGILLVLSLNFDKIRENHTLWKKDQNSFFYNRAVTTPLLKSLSGKFGLTADHVIFNCRPEDNVPIMFFNDIVAAYNHIPDSSTYIDLKNRGYKIALFDNNNLPLYLATDPEVMKIGGYWN